MTSSSEDPEPEYPTTRTTSKKRKADVEEWEQQWSEWAWRRQRAKIATDRARVKEWLAYFFEYPYCDIDASLVIGKLSYVPSAQVLRIIAVDAPSCVSSWWLSLVVLANGGVRYEHEDERDENLLGRCARVRAAMTVVPISLLYEVAGPAGRGQRFTLGPERHALALIVDHARRTAEFFNPIGALQPEDEAVQELVETQLARDLPDYRMVHQLAFCPHLGPQSIEASGSCASWSLLYAFLRIEQPALEPEAVFQEMLADATPAKLRRLVEGFGCWVWAHPQIRALDDSRELREVMRKVVRPNMQRIIYEEVVPAFVADATWRSQYQHLLRIHYDLLKITDDATDASDAQIGGSGYVNIERSFGVPFRAALHELHDAMRALVSTEGRIRP
ncbi:Hypothetical protein UVM_LOCUS129 [uncultured virus]|nr:Hypothetical protein UVM_LOCUS129 [uncultured virus]